MTLFRRTARAWTNLSLRVKGLVVVSVPVVALLLSAILIFQVEKKKDEIGEWIKHTQDVHLEVLNIYIAMISAESAIRDYALTGHEAALQPYDIAGPSIEVVLDRIKDLEQDSPEQRHRLARLKELAHQRLDLLKSLRGYYDSPQTRGKEAPQELLRQGKTSMDEELGELAKFLTAETRLSKEHTKSNEALQRVLYDVIGACVVVGLLGGILAVWLFMRGIVRRVQEAESGAHRLEQGLPPAGLSSGNDELGRLASALERTGTILNKQGGELKLALEAGQVLIWELEPKSGLIRYQAGSEALKTARFPRELLPETMNGWLTVVHTDDRDTVRTELNRVLNDGGSFQIEYRVVLGGGEIRWMAAKGQFQGDDPGGPGHLLGVLIDTTERRKAADEILKQARELTASREALQQQTRILRSILDSMGDGVVVADRQGQFIIFNPAAEKTLGVRAFSGEPEKWSEHYGLFQADMVTRYRTEQLPFERTIRGESVDGVEMFIRPSGASEGTWTSINARPLREEDGSIRGAVMVMRDVSASKQDAAALKVAKEEAERANQAKSDFLSRMSHELRTPLNSVIGFTQLLEIDDLSGDQRDSVNHILKGGRHLLNLINEVLDLARIESGRLPISLEAVHLTEALEEAVAIVQPLANQRKITINADAVLRCDHHVLADRQRLKQVLLNLLSNAVKYNGAGGTVSLSCCNASDDRLRIEITDTGIGIPSDYFDKLFLPFERLHADDSEVEGTGLGLALSKRLMEAMGGTIGLESVVNQGSTFWIELSLKEDPVEAAQEAGLAPSLSDSSHDGYRGTVLYIEDNLANMNLMERILRHRPQIKLLTALQGRLGLDLALQHRPDLILLDLHLPDVPGKEVLRLLRENPKTKDIPVTIISADATPGQIERMLAAGAQDYISKPLDVSEILTHLDQVLRNGELDGERSTSEQPHSHH
jgi:PAS domain S-box-containing protein